MNSFDELYFTIGHQAGHRILGEFSTTADFRNKPFDPALREWVPDIMGYALTSENSGVVSRLLGDQTQRLFPGNRSPGPRYKEELLQLRFLEIARAHGMDGEKVLRGLAPYMQGLSPGVSVEKEFVDSLVKYFKLPAAYTSNDVDVNFNYIV